VEVLDDKIVRGIVAGTRGAGSLPVTVTFIAGAHPDPDEQSIRAGSAALAIAAGAHSAGELVLALLSGGGSAMLALPVEGITLADKSRTIAVLSRAGVSIAGINTVRKHLSAIKGGRLGAAIDGPALTLAISDVHPPHDQATTIASGPTVADPTTFADALRVIDEAGAGVPAPVRAHLERGAQGRIPETPKPGDSRLASAAFHVIADRWLAMAGAMREAERRGYVPRILDAPTSGEASGAGEIFAARAGEVAPVTKPGLCVIGSGETTVTVRGQGRGGRNQEFAIGAALALHGRASLAAVCSAGTDGVDGPTDAAGGVVTSSTASQALEAGVDLRGALADNDSYRALDALGALVRWGPTLTNVGDVHVLLTMAS
jgi:glycerate-2-kinase